METTTTDLPQADKSVSRVAILLWLAVFVAIAVLIIDQGIKRAIVAEGEKALKILAEVRRASHGTGTAGEATASPGDSVNPDHGVDDAAGASAEPVPDAGNGLGPEAGRVARPLGGPRGDG